MKDIIQVAINGYGTIGKRVADAVMLQDDMELIGITGHSFNYRLEIAQDLGIDIYSAGDPKYANELVLNGINVKGNVKDLVRKSDIVVDCSPKPFGKSNIENLYKPLGKKAILQGGEKSSAVQCSFVAQCNYEKATGLDYVRVVSCNTTGLSRSLHALDKAFKVVKARATLIRRAGDPANIARGPINSIIPSFELPSHHGPDVRTVLPKMEIFTTAVVVPTTLMHMHNLSVVLEQEHDIDEVIDVFRKETRIRVIGKNKKLDSTANIMEMARDLGYKRSDMNELCVWEKGIGHYDGELFFPQAVHQESIVVPENIDCIRSMFDIMEKEESISKTNKSLNIK